MSIPAFSGQVPFADPTVPPGGCEYGQVRCIHPAELEVHLPGNEAERRLCRGHVGWYMLAMAGQLDWSLVEVRRIAPSADGDPRVTLRHATRGA